MINTRIAATARAPSKPYRHARHKQARMLTLFAALSLLSACSTLSGTTATSGSTASVNPLTAAMPAIDRSGHIAYVEEQGMGANKISTLYVIRPDGSERQQLAQLSGYIYSPAWSADGQYLAYSKQALRESPKIYIYDRKHQSHRLLVGGQGSNLSATFAPDGQTLLYSSTVDGNADIYQVRLTDGHTTQLTTLPSTEVQPSYAPDGQSFVYVSDKVRAGQPRIYRYDLASKRVQQIATSGYAASPQLSMDGTRMGYLNGRQAAVMTLADGAVLNLAQTGLDEPARLSPSASYAIYPQQYPPNSAQKGSYLVVRSLTGNRSYMIGGQDGGVVRSPAWGR